MAVTLLPVETVLRKCRVCERWLVLTLFPRIDGRWGRAIARAVKRAMGYDREGVA